MRNPDLSLRVSLRKQPCVLDPALIVAHRRGPELALRLTQVLEPWLTRSFWQIIDSSELLAAEPAPDAGVDRTALAAWITLRDHTDAGSWPLRWVGDNLPESQLPDEASVDLVDRYERLAQSLGERTELLARHRFTHCSSLEPVQAALDAVALSATLGGALILGAAPAGGEAPWAAQAAAHAGLEPVKFEDAGASSLFATEREWLRASFVSAGLAPLAHCLPALAVMHVLAETRDADDPDDAPDDPWSGARAWWYPL